MDLVCLNPRPQQVSSRGRYSSIRKPPPRNTRTQIHIPLIHDVVKIKKEPYVKEEIVIIGKKPSTETKSLSESMTKEEVDTSSKK
jgi:stress response protein YsnF